MDVVLPEVKRSPCLAFFSWVFIGPKSISHIVIIIIVAIVSKEYRLYGMALIKRVYPSVPSTTPATAAAQEEIGAIIQTGAAVASIK